MTGRDHADFFCADLPAAGLNTTHRAIPDIKAGDFTILYDVYAERIRRATSESLYQDTGLPEPCTVSIGIACLPEDGQTPQGALESADKALYAAKDGGRDRVVLFT